MNPSEVFIRTTSMTSAASKAVRALVDKLDWTPFRKPPVVCDYELSGKAQAWLYSIPVHSRPLLLSRRFPRVANRLAEIWADNKALDAYVEDLLVDNRGGSRQGFPVAIRDEILTLRTYVTRERSRRAKVRAE